MKECSQCKSPFEITPEDKVFYAKMDVPEPSHCPDCRKQRHLAWRNERNLYKRKCDMCGKMHISIYSQEKPFKVFCQNCWWSDKWNTLDFGRDFDFSRPFFEQFRELQLKVPRLSLLNARSENSEYNNHSSDTRNCYMGCDIGHSEDIYYSNWIIYSKNLIDCTKTIKSEMCYECLDCNNLYNCFYAQECENCSDSFILYDCRDCRNCIACSGLRNKENYLFNKPVAKEEIDKIRHSFGSFSVLKKYLGDFEELKLKIPRVFMRQAMSEDVSGEFVEKCKNVHESYLVFDARDCKFVTESADMKDCYDVHSMWIGEKLYEVHAGIYTNNSIAVHKSDYSNNIYYCDTVYNSQNCFGSVCLNHNKYCIFNKQYSKEDYEKLTRQIIKHMQKTKEWGEFFPIALSPFAYNETIANQYFPLKKEEVFKRNMTWKDYAYEKINVEKTIPANRLPDGIKDIPDDILNWAIECSVSKKLFRIISQELKFYKKNSLPIPRLHPDERYNNRVGLRNPRILFDRKCDKCASVIRTTYAPDRPEKVYCEKCYLKTVY